VRTPLIGDAAAPVTQPYGCTTFTAEPADFQCPSGHFHTGIDLGIPCGTPVYAGGPARVSMIGTPPEPGICNGLCDQGCLGPHAVILQLPDHSHVAYGHLERNVVRRGQIVHRGQLLGYSGTMGCSTGCHVHIEHDRPGGLLLTINGSVNPAGILAGWRGRIPVPCRPPVRAPHHPSQVRARAHPKPVPHTKPVHHPARHPAPHPTPSPPRRVPPGIVMPSSPAPRSRALTPPSTGIPWPAVAALGLIGGGVVVWGVAERHRNG